ncbi:amino acid adenylation domain-containing protein [Streptomyces phaeolivaceus]|uniref:amino acid adenylation domain-containing protein n=1 Tax=Streptomyces phaeolivaceus TaxID=2653200 RepID=UPI001869F3BB|nr:amino acid adenylation domain-containing protein [Streptomyces phaeolivaceus]
MTAERGPRAVIHRRFEARAERFPRATALESADTRITYAEANRRANRLAHRLHALGVGGEQRVALLLEPSFDYVLAALAVLKAGGCYVPLDIGHPPARLAAVLADTEATVVITRGDLAARAAGHGARTVLLDDASEPSTTGHDGNLDVPVRSDHLAYVVHTSGSSGRPKGVMVPHGGVVRLVQDPDWIRLGPGEVIPLLTSVCFDVSMFEMWGALLNGGCLVLAPGATASLRALGRVVADHGVTTMWLTAGLFHTVVDEGVELLTGVRQLLAGGEAPSAEHVRKLLDAHPGIRFVNGYGPTEATVFAATHTVVPPWRAQESVPIGKAVGGTDLHVLDDALQPLPAGEPGQLFIGGAGLARGYLNRPGLTAERFLPHPYGAAGERLYVTGDRCVRLLDGTIRYLGRIDRQVKVRGFRVELGEIEATVRRHPAVRDVTVTAHGDSPESRVLIAYPVLAPSRTPDADQALAEVRSWLGEQLPAHMIPGVWRVLGRLPLTSNGKVDRRRLPEPFAA